MTTDDQVKLVKITEETVRTITSLEVAENQKDFVATNAESLSQALFSRKAWYRAIYAGNTPVGFVMLYIDIDKSEYDVWRFMIDHRCQGKGYGYRAMELVIGYIRQHPGAKKLELSYGPGEGNPSGFYAKLGFVETGKIHEGERVMELIL